MKGSKVFFVIKKRKNQKKSVHRLKKKRKGGRMSEFELKFRGNLWWISVDLLPSNYHSLLTATSISMSNIRKTGEKLLWSVLFVCALQRNDQNFTPQHKANNTLSTPKASRPLKSKKIRKITCPVSSSQPKFWSNSFQKQKQQLSNLSDQVVAPGSNMEKRTKKLLEWGFFSLSAVICWTLQAKTVSNDVYLRSLTFSDVHPANNQSFWWSVVLSEVISAANMSKSSI